MHRCAATLIAAQRDDDVATVGIAALRLVVRPIYVQTHFFQQSFGGNQRVERAEYPLEMAGIVDEAAAGPALACNERTGRQAEAQRRYYLVDARFVLAGVGADDPQRIGMLLETALLEAHHRPGLTLGVHLRGTEPVAHTFLVHEIQEKGLGCLAEYVAGEVHVLGRAFHHGAGAEMQAHELSPASLREALGHAGRAQITAAVVRQY